MNKIKNIFTTIKSWALSHKVWSVVIIMVILGGGLFTYKKIVASNQPTQYVLGTVKKGNLVASVNGTGQVSATNQIDLKPKVSGTITGLYIKAGQSVNKGAAIAQLDATDAVKAVRDAKLNLESAQLSLAKLKSQISQSQNTSVNDLGKTYDEGFNTVSAAFIDFPAVIANLDYLVKNTPYLSSDSVRSFGSLAVSYRNSAIKSYYQARDDYANNLTHYKATTRESNSDDIDTLIEETHQTSQAFSSALKDMTTLINYLSAPGRSDSFSNEATLPADKATLNSETASINSDLNSILSIQSTITDAKNAAINNNQGNSESQSSLDLKTAELTVEQRQNALADAQSNLADYTVRAPFAGVVGTVPVSLAAEASSATTIATLVTKEQLAVIQLNEVDVSKVTLGDKANVTFDAVPDLTISGTIVEIEALGTISQGVVTYNVKISFDTQDNRIKPNMTASASIITDSKNDVLILQNSAVKTAPRGGSYVEEFNDPSLENQNTFSTKLKPTRVPVEVGLSNDTETEIVSGLKEGDKVVERTIASGTSAPASSAPSLFGGGARTGGGGANRTISR